MARKYTPNAAYGIIRGGPIPNPGRHIPVDEREENPKEILGIFVNPDEDRPKTTKARNGMRKKNKRKSTSTKRRKRKSTSARKSTRRRTATKRTTIKRRTTAKRKAAPKRKRRRNSKKKMTAAQARAKLRRLMNPRSLPGRSSGRGRSSYGAGELKGGLLLDVARRDAMLDAEIAELQAEAANSKDPVVIQELASLIAQRDRLSSGMGLLDSVLLESDAPAVQEFKKGLFSVAGKRKERAAKRAARAKTRQGSKQKQEDFFAAKAIKIAAELAGVDADDLPKSKVPFLRKKFDQYSEMTGSPSGRKDMSFEDINVPSRSQGKAALLERLLILPPSALMKAKRALDRNYIAATTDAGAEQMATLSMIQDSLADAMGGGRLENPRRKKRRKSSKRRKSARGRRSAKRRSSRKRRRNPSGILGQVMGLARTAAVASAGYVSVSLVDQILMRTGAEKQIASIGGANSKIGAVLYEAIASGSTILGWWLLSGTTGARSFREATAGAAIRGIRGVVDRTLRPKSSKDTSAMVRQAFALPATVSGYGTWSPQMEGYYNFQPVMNGMLSPGYGSMSGWDAGYGSMAGYQNFAPTMDGYQNFAPTMAGYQNFAPTMSGWDAGYGSMAGYQNFAPTMGKGGQPF